MKDDPMSQDPESLAAAADLYRLAQAEALLRLHAAGRSAERPIKPREADHAAVARAHPELVALANRSNPHLSGEN